MEEWVLKDEGRRTEDGGVGVGGFLQGNWYYNEDVLNPGMPKPQRKLIRLSDIWLSLCLCGEREISL